MPTLALLQNHNGKKFKETVKEDPSIAFETEGGYAITRRRHRRRPARTFTLGFDLLTDAEKTQIMDFYSLCGGAADIVTGWTHPVSGIETPVRFKPGTPPVFTYRGAGSSALWDATVELEEV